MSISDVMAQSPAVLVIYLVIGLAFLVAVATIAAMAVTVAKESRAKREKSEAEVALRVHDPASSLTLDEIWEIADRERFLHAIDLWLVRKRDRHINSGFEAPALSPAECAAYDVLAFDLHAYFNGLYDFWLCYGYDDGAGAYEAALREVGAAPAADLWHDAVALIEGSCCNPLDPKLDDPELARALSMLDFGYRENSEKVKELLCQYILCHKGEFSE